MNCPHDYENDDCTNCANGLPPFHCLMNDEEGKQMSEKIICKTCKHEPLTCHDYCDKEVEDKIAKARADERSKVIEQIEEWLKKQFEEQNGSNSQYIPTVVLNELVFSLLEKLKEQSK